MHSVEGFDAAPRPAFDPSSAPLTPDQARAVVLYEAGLHPANGHVALVLVLSGSLDLPRLQRALTALARKHDALRARVTTDAHGELKLQVDAEPPAFVLCARDVASQHELSAALAEHVSERLELSRACSSVKLLRSSRDEHVLSLVAHRVVCDDASLAVLARHLPSAYEAPESFTSGSALASRLWARIDERAKDTWAAEIARRAEPLRGELPAIDLPTDRPRPPAFSGQGASVSRTLGAAAMSRLHALAQSRSVTLGDVFVTTFIAFVQRWANAYDITLGIESSRSSELSPQASAANEHVGPFTTPSVIRAAAEASTQLGDLLQQVSERRAAHATGSAVDLQELVRALAVSRDRARPAVFQVSVQLDVPFDADREQAGLRVSRIEAPVLGVRTDLNLRVRPSGEATQIAFDYASDLFHESSVTRMLDGFLVALESLGDPSLPIGRVPMMTPEARAQALSAVDVRPCDFTKHTFLRFEENVARNGAATAVVFQGQSLSYEELNRRANRVAHRLIKHGVTQDSLVGVYCERSFDMLIAVIGVMKSGGAYVPLDPAHPPARTQAIVEDARVKALLTQIQLADRAPTHTSVEKLLLDDGTLAQEPEHNPGVVVSPNALAYVIFTSGSTGRPKGVGVEHGSLNNFLVSMAHTPGLTQRDRVLSVTTLSFDIAGLELHLPMTVGASVEIADRATCIDAEALAARLADPAITVLQATPASFRLLLKLDWPGKKGLKILCGGEAFPPDLISALLTRVGEVWNMYGPTETTVWSTCRRLLDANTPVSVGGPIDNTAVYVLSPLLEPVPRGAIGEIYLGGDGVARGYYERPDLTSQRFVPDPFSDKPGARMYQTGDLGHFLPDGSLTCMGRVDFQVKIRGFRIEIGEIEKALLACAGVMQAVVTAWEPEPGDKRLVAYVVSREADEAKLAETLRTELSRVLPSYMVPAFFTKLETLPLNPSGKVDRKALPAPSQTAGAATANAVAVQNDLEAQIHDVFARVLGVTSVSADASFFEAGGDSLLAVKLLRELHSVLGVQVPLLTLFEAPNIRDLAARLDDSEDAAATTRAVVLRRGKTQHKLFCVCGIAIYQHLARALPSELSVLGVYVPAEEEIYDIKKLRRGQASMPSVEELASEYAEVIRREQPEGPYLLAGVSFGGVIAYELARQLEAVGEKVSFLGLFDALLPDELNANLLHQILRPLRGLARHRHRRTAVAKLAIARLVGGDKLDWTPNELEAMRDTLHEIVVTRYVRNLKPYSGSAVIVTALDRKALGFDPNVSSSEGWQSVVKGGVTQLELPGDHLGILRPPFVEALANGLAPHLVK